MSPSHEFIEHSATISGAFEGVCRVCQGERYVVTIVDQEGNGLRLTYFKNGYRVVTTETKLFTGIPE